MHSLSEGRRSSRITLLPSRAPDPLGAAKHSTRLLDRASPFEMPSIRTAQAPGILVIDDELEIRELVAEILSTEGYVVFPARNGAEALGVLSHTRVSLVLLDMRMPVLDGWSFARRLRERRTGLPILVMSAAGNALQLANDIGAAGCLSKPFDVLELLALVERFVAPH